MAYSFYHFYSQQWKEEEWQPKFLKGDSNLTLKTVNRLGTLLLQPNSSKLTQTRIKTLFQSLAKYIDSPIDPTGHRIFYFLDQKEPESFSKYFSVSLKDFIVMDDSNKSALFRKRVESQFPDESTLKDLSNYLSPHEQFLFMRECFKFNPLSSFALLEKTRYFTPSTEEARSSREADFFPNLPQDTPYNIRQKYIDAFLGTPSLTQYKAYFRNGQDPIKVTLKKYLWKYNTEVFSIESGKPGPTTLVFSPHFHENNPRKQFHWTQNIPLQSGRIILLPEANRGMREICESTNPMNGLFNRAFTNDQRDYVIVRKVEFLMGVVDGLVGLHDSQVGPFFISDVVKNHKNGKNFNPNPVPSNWIPEEVRKIEKIKEPGGVYTRIVNKVTPAQTQWQIAQYANQRLEKLSGGEFRFEPEWIKQAESNSANSATGYMNFHLGKPAMTFEGMKGKEHGQLHAMALYSLLLGFGHKIDPEYEKNLKKPFPKIPPLYIGLPVTTLPSPPMKNPVKKKLQPRLASE